LKVKKTREVLEGPEESKKGELKVKLLEEGSKVAYTKLLLLLDCYFVWNI
jgi:hypothetical protein